MRRTLTWRLGTIIIGLIICTLIITYIAIYKTAYDRMYEAAGVEAYGCANITTALLDTGDIQDLIAGENGAKIGEKLNWTVDHKAIFENQYILSLDGEILALDENLSQQGFSIGDEFYFDKQAIQTLVESKHSTYSEIYEFGEMDRISGYAPIFWDHDPTQEIIAVSVIDFNAEIVEERTWDVVKDGIMLSIIPLVIAAIITLYLIRKKTKPISDLIEQTRLIAEGDLTERDLHITSKDEVGDLARNLEVMTGHLRKVIATIKGTSENLVQNSTDTSTSMNEMSIALGQVSTNMEEVAAGTTEGVRMTVDASNALTNLSDLIRSSKNKADSSVISAEHTMETAGMGIEKVQEVVERMNIIKSSTQDTQQSIGRLSAYTNEIQQITETIAAIADQTNLLALNATIEAARAGEHGKGFAVVADEVRKLAEQSNKEASEVEKIVSKITTNIKKTVASVDESFKNVEEGEQTVNETGESLEKIRTAVNNIVGEIRDLSALTNDEAGTSDHIVQLVNHLEEENEKMAAHAQEVSAASEESTATVDDVASRSGRLTEMANELNDSVNKFRGI